MWATSYSSAGKCTHIRLRMDAGRPVWPPIFKRQLQYCTFHSLLILQRINFLSYDLATISLPLADQALLYSHRATSHRHSCMTCYLSSSAVIFRRRDKTIDVVTPNKVYFKSETSKNLPLRIMCWKQHFRVYSELGYQVPEIHKHYHH